MTVTELFSFLKAHKNHHENGDVFEGKKTIVIDGVRYYADRPRN